MTDHDAAGGPAAEGASEALTARIIRQLGWNASAHAVYGEPVRTEHCTVIPVARVFYLLGAGTGPELAGRSVEHPAETAVRPALSSGGGGGGIGVAQPAGHIEIGPGGTRFVPARRDWTSLTGLSAVALLSVIALRALFRR